MKNNRNRSFSEVLELVEKEILPNPEGESEYDLYIIDYLKKREKSKDVYAHLLGGKDDF